VPGYDSASSNTPVRQGKNLPDAVGGDYADKLSAIEIEAAAQQSVVLSLPCRLLYDWYEGRIPDRTVIDCLRRIPLKGVFILWIRHHWLAGIRTGDKTWTIFDSARSAPVSRSLRRIAVLVGWETPTMASIPQQKPGSNECGIFALVFAFLAAENKIPLTAARGHRLDLGFCRQLLQENRFDEFFLRATAAVLEHYGKDVAGRTGTEPKVWRHNPYAVTADSSRIPSNSTSQPSDISGGDIGRKRVVCRCDTKCRGRCPALHSDQTPADPDGGAPKRGHTDPGQQTRQGPADVIDVDADERSPPEQLRDEIENLIALYEEACADIVPASQIHGQFVDRMCMDAVAQRQNNEWEVITVAEVPVRNLIQAGKKWIKPVHHGNGKDAHYFLVVYTPDQTTVYDSLPQHLTQSRRDAVWRLTGRREFTLVSTAPQCRNDCGVKVIEKVRELLGCPSLPGDTLRERVLRPVVSALRGEIADKLSTFDELRGEHTLTTLLMANELRRTRPVRETNTAIGETMETDTPAAPTKTLSALATPFLPATREAFGEKTQGTMDGVTVDKDGNKGTLVNTDTTSVPPNSCATVTGKMSDAEAVSILAQLHPGREAVVTWAFDIQPDTMYKWLGKIYEGVGTKKKRVWPIQYEIIDLDGDTARVSSQIPRPPPYMGYAVHIRSIVPCDEVRPRPEDLSVRVKPPVNAPPSHCGNAVYSTVSSGMNASLLRVPPVPHLSRTPSPVRVLGPEGNCPPPPSYRQFMETAKSQSPPSYGEFLGALATKEKSPEPLEPVQVSKAKDRSAKALQPRPGITLEMTPPMVSPSPTRPFDQPKPPPQELISTQQEKAFVQGRRGGTKIAQSELVGERQFRAQLEPGGMLDPEDDEELTLIACPLTEEQLRTAAPLLYDPTAVKTFGELRKLVSAQATTAHPVALKALTVATRDEHRRVLQGVVLDMPTNYEEWPVGKALLERTMRLRAERKWKWSTTLKKCATLQGALRILPMYVASRSVDLTSDVEWSSGLKYIASRSREEQPRSVKPARMGDIQKAIDGTDTVPLKAALALSWILAARFGDVLGLQFEDLSLTDDGDECNRNNIVTVTYRRGKTVARRGPYSVHSHIPDVWVDYIRAAGTGKRSGKIFGRIKVADMTSALRRGKQELEARSVRRGSLQLMASNGVGEETLLLFSGHTTLLSLRRYLNWGAVGNVKRNTMVVASKTLEGPTGGGTTTVSNEERVPRFLHHLGSEAPPSREFLRMGGRKIPQGTPLHAKSVIGRIDVGKVKTLPMPPKLRELVSANLRWLDDDSLYLALSDKERRHLDESRLKYSAADLRKLLNLKKLEITENKYRRGGARSFCVYEAEKSRRRPIWEPYLNDAFTSVPTVEFLRAHERREIIGRYNFGLLYDFASFYDQMSLHERVRDFHAGRLASGEYVRPTTLPMGFRPACAVAQAICWAIVEGVANSTGCRLLTYIDNILVLGNDKAEILKVAAKLRETVSYVGGEFNEKDAASDEGRIATTFEFLGERYDLGAKTVCNTIKTMAKIRTVVQYLKRLSPRGHQTDLQLSRREVAAIFGIGMFASNVSSWDLCEAYWPLRFYRELASSTHWDAWDSKAPLCPTSTYHGLLRWLNELLLISPQPLGNQALPPVDAYIFVDASATGWGAVCISAGKALVESQKWAQAEQMEKSVQSEPCALFSSLCRFVLPTWRRVVVLTDHLPLVYAARSGYAKAFSYNVLLQRIRKHFPTLSVDVEFIPSCETPADGPSRGTAIDEKKLENAWKFTREKEEEKEKRENGVDGPEWFKTAHNPVRERTVRRVACG